MSSSHSGVDLPARLRIDPDAGMDGRSDHYEVCLSRLEGVYVDHGAYRQSVLHQGADALMYFVDSHSYSEVPGSLTIGTSTLLPGKVGEEYAVTRGHIHARADRAELYYCISGHGLMLMETLDGTTEVVELTPGVAAHVPGGWIHRSVNVGAEPLVTVFCYNSDAGQDYGVIGDAGGMKCLVVDDGTGGWELRRNPRHTGYPAR